MSEIKVKAPEKIFICNRCQTETSNKLKYKHTLPHRFSVNDTITTHSDICLSCFFLIKRNFRNCVYA